MIILFPQIIYDYLTSSLNVYSWHASNLNFCFGSLLVCSWGRNVGIAAYTFLFEIPDFSLVIIRCVFCGGGEGEGSGSGEMKGI